jgi:hypothetical protein
LVALNDCVGNLEAPYSNRPLPPDAALVGACSGGESTGVVARYAASAAYAPTLLWYDTTYIVFAVISTGLAKSTCCHPDGVSFANTAEARCVPAAVHRLPTCVPTLSAPL